MTGPNHSSRQHPRVRAAAGIALSAATVAGTLSVAGSAAAAETEVAAAQPLVAGPVVAGPVVARPLLAENRKIIAHRGDRDNTPENTLAAFGSAIAKGAEAIEMDVQFSSSGYPVVIHDYGLRRTTDCTGRVSSKTVRQLHKCDAGSWFGSEFEGEKIPTLWEALKFINKRSDSVKVVLHMKSEPTRRQARKTMHRVRMNRMSDRTIVMASTVTAMSRMKRAGAKKRAFIFNYAAGWDHKYSIMVPYEIPLDESEVAAANRRGATVWAVQGHPLDVPALLGLGSPVRGIIVNHLNHNLVDTLNGVLGSVTDSLAPLTTPLTTR